MYVERYEMVCPIWGATNSRSQGRYSIAPSTMLAGVISVTTGLDALYAIRGPSLWSSGQSSWLLTQRPWVRFWRYRIFCVAVGLERGPLSLVRINEELLKEK
jgi:hypothetical protein